MNFGEDDAVNEEIVRFPRSRKWLQLHVDLFMTSCPEYCKALSLTVVHDPERRNGCNWQLAVSAPEDKAEHEFLCLQHIAEDLQLLFSVFDLETE
jgi:hypothetical protein